MLGSGAEQRTEAWPLWVPSRPPAAVPPGWETSGHRGSIRNEKIRAITGSTPGRRPAAGRASPIQARVTPMARPRNEPPIRTGCRIGAVRRPASLTCYDRNPAKVRSFLFRAVSVPAPRGQRRPVRHRRRDRASPCYREAPDFDKQARRAGRSGRKSEDDRPGETRLVVSRDFAIRSGSQPRGSRRDERGLGPAVEPRNGHRRIVAGHRGVGPDRQLARADWRSASRVRSVGSDVR